VRRTCGAQAEPFASLSLMALFGRATLTMSGDWGKADLALGRVEV
jgi:hypothetical protein